MCSVEPESGDQEVQARLDWLLSARWSLPVQSVSCVRTEVERHLPKAGRQVMMIGDKRKFNVAIITLKDGVADTALALLEGLLGGFISAPVSLFQGRTGQTLMLWR